MQSSMERERGRAEAAVDARGDRAPAEGSGRGFARRIDCAEAARDARGGERDGPDRGTAHGVAGRGGARRLD